MCQNVIETIINNNKSNTGVRAYIIYEYMLCMLAKSVGVEIGTFRYRETVHQTSAGTYLKKCDAKLLFWKPCPFNGTGADAVAYLGGDRQGRLPPHDSGTSFGHLFRSVCSLSHRVQMHINCCAAHFSWVTQSLLVILITHGNLKVTFIVSWPT
jgi:hypothetical protein